MIRTADVFKLKMPFLKTVLASLVLFVAFASIGTSIWLVNQSRSSTAKLPYAESFVNWVGPNPTLDSAVAASEVIVVGRVSGIDRLEKLYPDGYVDDDRHLPDGVDPGVVFTDFSVEVDTYLKGAGSSTLTLRLTGDMEHTNGTLELPRPSFGEPMILFLTRTPGADGVWQSRGPWGQMVAFEGTVSYVWRADDDSHAPRPVPYFEGFTFDQAVDAVRSAAGRE